MKIRKFFQQYKLVIVLSLLIISFSLLAMLFINMEPDYYWHLKAGEYMVKHQEILTHDIFSWIVAGKYWMSHEWLFEVMIYGLKVIFGQFHVFIYCFSMVAILGLFLFFTNLKSYLKNVPFTLLWISFSLLIFSAVSCRPHLLSFLLLAISIYLLRDFYDHPNSRKIFFLPVVSLIWANVHGGSSNLPYLLCLLFLFCSVFQFSFFKIESKRLEKKQIFTYFLVMLFCIGACFFNPHGAKLLIYPYQNMSDGLMLSTIAEWQPTNLNKLAHYGYLIVVATIFLVFLISEKKIKFLDFVLFLFALYLGVKSIRFWFYIYIISSFFIFYYVKTRKEDAFSIPIILFVGILIFSFFITQFQYDKLFKIEAVSNDAITLLQEEKPKRLYNDYDYGGYLIFYDILVFIDGRADLYSSYNYSDYQKISRLSYQFVSLLETYKFDYFITAKTSGLASYLEDNEIYEQLFQDKKTVIYKKKTA